MLLRLAWRNIWRNKRRSYITITSIAFAVLFACLFMSMQYGSLTDMVNKSVRFYTGHVQIQQQGYWAERTLDNSMSYSPELLSQIEQVEGITVAVPRVESFALSAFENNTRPAMVFGVDLDREDQITSLSEKLTEGERVQNGEKAVLIGAGLADYLKIGVGDTLVLISQGYHGVNAAGLFPIKGIVKFSNPGQNKQFVAMSLEHAQYFYGMEDRVTSIAILANGDQPLEETLLNIKAQMGSEDLAILDYLELMPELVQILDMKFSSSRIMIMVLYAVIGFGMFGTFLMMTAERMREFGIMLSVGMKRLKLQVTTFMEISMMSLIGVLIGISISLVIIIYFYYNPIDLGSQYQEISDQYNMEVELVFSADPKVFYEQAWAIFVISFILSFYPLLVLFKLKPVDAMRKG